MLQRSPTAESYALAARLWTMFGETREGGEAVAEAGRSDDRTPPEALAGPRARRETTGPPRAARRRGRAIGRAVGAAALAAAAALAVWLWPRPAPRRQT